MSQQQMFLFNNGDKVKDEISGVTGIVITRADHLYGCNRYWVTPQETKDGKPVEGCWHDEDALELVQGGAIQPRVRVGARSGDDSLRKTGGAILPPSTTHARR